MTVLNSHLRDLSFIHNMRPRGKSTFVPIRLKGSWRSSYWFTASYPEVFTKNITCTIACPFDFDPIEWAPTFNYSSLLFSQFVLLKRHDDPVRIRLSAVDFIRSDRSVSYGMSEH